MAVTASVAVVNAVVLVERFGGNESLRAIIICNRSGTANTIRIWAVPADTIRGDEHAICYDLAIRGNETIIIEMHDIMMTANEEIWAEGGGSATISVSLFNNRISTLT